MNNISIKGVLLGILAIVVLDVISAFVMLLLFPSSVSVESQILETWPLIYGLVIGTATTTVGGFIAAYFGKTAPYKNSGIIGILGVFLGILLFGEAPLWSDVSGLISVVPAALLGGYLVARKNV